MEREIIADVNPNEARVALIENGELAEIQVEMRGYERLVGNIYKGRVVNILPGMQAAFLDIGLERNAFLYAGDILVDKSDFEFSHDLADISQSKLCLPNIQDVLKKDQEIMVQVLKQPGGTKGARVTTHITLPGRAVVLMPTVDHIGVSRRIVDTDERERLKALIAKVKPEGMGVIVRTAAEYLSEDEFVSEIMFLARLWEKVQEKADFVSAPRLIHAEETLLFRTIRDLLTDEVTKFVINDKDYYEKVLAVVNITVPEMADRVQLYSEKENIFDVYGIESKIERAMARKVWMKNGCYLVIDEAEALSVIDVNTGKYIGEDDLQETILNANLEAAKEIAKQIRLRDLSGIIVVDFIDMDNEENKQRVVEELEKELAFDRTRTNVIGITELGLVQLTRKKVRRKLSSVLQTTCPYCGGSGKVYSTDAMAMRVRREVIRVAAMQKADKYLVEVAQPLARFIIGKNNANEAILPIMDDATFYILGNDQMHIHDIKVSPVSTDKDKEKVSRSKIFC